MLSLSHDHSDFRIFRSVRYGAQAGMILVCRKLHITDSNYRIRHRHCGHMLQSGIRREHIKSGPRIWSWTFEFSKALIATAHPCRTETTMASYMQSPDQCFNKPPCRSITDGRSFQVVRGPGCGPGVHSSTDEERRREPAPQTNHDSAC
jgi:hypothetical protein